MPSLPCGRGARWGCPRPRLVAAALPRCVSATCAAPPLCSLPAPPRTGLPHLLRPTPERSGAPRARSRAAPASVKDLSRRVPPGDVPSLPRGVVYPPTTPSWAHAPACGRRLNERPPGVVALCGRRHHSARTPAKGQCHAACSRHVPRDWLLLGGGRQSPRARALNIPGLCSARAQRLCRKAVVGWCIIFVPSPSISPPTPGFRSGALPTLIRPKASATWRPRAEKITRLAAL